MRAALAGWWKDRPLRFKGRAVVGVPVLALVISSVVFLSTVSAIARSNELIDHTERIRTEVNEIQKLLVDAETGVRGYLLTQEDRFLAPYHDALAELPRHRSQLDALVTRGSAARGRVEILSGLIDRRLAVSLEALESSPVGRMAVLEAGRVVMDEIRQTVSEMDEILADELGEAEHREEVAISRAIWAATAGVLMALIAGFVGIRVFIRDISRGVATNTDNTERLAQGLPLRDPPAGADEIGRSGRALVAASERLAERERTIRENEHLLALILERLGDGVVVADPQGRFVVFNEAAEQMLGLGALERDPSEWSATYGILREDGEPYPPEAIPLARAIRGESVDDVDLVVRNPERPDGLRISVSGRPVLDEEGRSRGGVVIFRDVTEERERERRLEVYRLELERLNRELHALATQDALTGLANRHGFEPLAEQLVTLAERRTEDLSLLFVDLDGLKAVNDRLGHDVGSQMIVDAAKAIRTVARGSDVTARIGGDEFVILMNGGAEAASQVMARLREHVARFNATSRRPFELSLSVGAASSTPQERRSLDDLITAADAGMYEDKRARRAQRGAL